MLPDDPRHGTYAGLNQHKSEGSPVCDDCALAASNYIRVYRRRKDLGMPMDYFSEPWASERPHWTWRRELADAALLGPTLEAAWRANA